MAFEKKPGELGALWVKSGRKGEWMSGTIEVDGQSINVVCFRVDSQHPKAPTWRVLKATPKDEPFTGPQSVAAPESEDIPF